MLKIINIHAAHAVIVSCLTMFLALAPAQAVERANSNSLRGHFFVVVWSYQAPDGDLVHAHTFSSYYRGDDLSRGVIRPSTISWLPASGVVEMFGSARGRNFSLDETLNMACGAGRKVRSWGPFEIRRELYQRAVQRISLLASGKVRYAMLNQGGINCIKAAGDITPQPFDAGILWGEEASAAVVRHLSPYFISGPVKASMPGIMLSRSCSGAFADGAEN